MCVCIFSSLIFIFLGIDTVTYKVIPASKAEERMTQVRKEYGYEGEVMYFVDNKDHVIGLLKKKTAWYVCLVGENSLQHKLLV